jgi:hypothetical protein
MLPAIGRIYSVQSLEKASPMRVCSKLDSSDDGTAQAAGRGDFEMLVVV